MALNRPEAIVTRDPIGCFSIPIAELVREQRLSGGNTGKMNP